MGWRDYIPDSVEDLAEDTAEKAGVVVQWGGNKVADLADDVGLDDAGNWIRDKSRSAANQLGANVAELELGQTEDPKKLVYGSVSKIRAQVAHLNDFQTAFESVGKGLKAMTEPAGLKGKAAEAFAKAVAKQPPRWFKAAEAFGKAADAMGRFADTVAWAQGQAKEALEEYNQAKKASQDAYDAHKKLVDTYNDAIRAKKDHLPPRPSETYDDPGTTLATAAQDKLDNARKQRNEQAQTAATAVRAARDAAPPKPSYAEQFENGMLYNNLAMTHLAGGVIKGAAGFLDFARGLNPYDPYNLTHPAEYATSLNSTAAGLVTAVNDPWGAGKQFLDEFMKDPNEGIGKILADAAGSKGLDALKEAGSAAKYLNDRKPGGSRGDHEKDPNHSSNRCRDNVCDGDPVDMATGRMLLPQTDIALPGSLPLVFQRTFDSSHRSGRWFGPTWSSTVDQRLEIDAQGVVFSCDEGSLLAYPHPAPGVPVMPRYGRRWPLDRVEDGYTLTDPNTGKVWHFIDHSDDVALLAQIDDRNGRWISFEHDEAGAPTSIVHHGGYHLKLTTSEGRVTALHLAGAAADGSDQEILRYSYTDGHLTHVTNSSGRPLRFACDEHGRITSWTDSNNNHYDYVYDDQDRCTYQSGSNGHVESHFTWGETDPSTGLRTTSITDGFGHTKQFIVNERSHVVAEIDALGGVTRFERGRDNQLWSRTDPLGNVERFTFDEAGRLTSIVRPDGRILSVEYDTSGLPVRAVGADGAVTRQTFDARGNCTSITGPSGATTHFTYDELGHLVATRDALGYTTVVRCNEAGLQVELTDPLGATTRITRDGFGRPISFEDALGSSARFEWTVEGHLARRVEADGSEQSWTYDGEGNCTSHTDALGGVTTYEYADFDLLTSRTGPDGHRYQFTHDINLRLTQVRNPQGLAWSYEYDPAGRLVTETDFDHRTIAYGYDDAGKLISRTNSMGQSIWFEYNALGQVVRKDAGGVVTTFEYDVFDELAVATTPDVALTRLRDRYGRLVAETVDGSKLTFEYDLLGRRTGRTTPSGAVSSWTYDAAGRRESLTAAGRLMTFERDAAGQEVVRRIGESVTLSHGYDVMGRMTKQCVNSHGRALQRRDYAYRADGNLIGIEDELAGSRRFDLDATGRVTAVRAENWTERYTYDSVGNQTEASWPVTHAQQEATGRRSYNGTQIIRAGNVRYERDAQGRIVLRQKIRLSRKPDTWRYTWDAEDRLTSVTTPDGSVWCYQYDALGRRVSKQRLADSGLSIVEQVSFVWDDSLLCEQTATATTLPHPVALTWDHDGLHPLTQTERILGPNAPQELVAERFFSIVTDLIGTPSELIDDEGNLAWRMRSTLWGTTTWAATSTTYTPLRFPGQYFDPETGLHYNYFRHYDPEVAQYLTPDPLGLAPAPTPRSYVSNPHIWSDPLGLKPCKKKTEDLNWNEKSRPTFGHTFSEHGAGTKNTQSLTDRARSTGNDQGQWLDNAKAVEYLKAHHDPNAGVREVPIPPGMGQVIKPDGSIVEPTHARLVPKPDGTYKTAFPIVK